MADPSNLEPSSLGGYLAWAVAALGSVYSGWAILRRNSSNNAVTDASNEANISAIDTYKQLLATERAARQASDERADKFAEERNEAWKQLYAAQGKIDLCAEQISNLNKEITMLRTEVAQLRGGATVTPS